MCIHLFLSTGISLDMLLFIHAHKFYNSVYVILSVVLRVNAGVYRTSLRGCVTFLQLAVCVFVCVCVCVCE